MGEGRPDQQIGYILRSYPRLSQTFVVNEILALEQAGVRIRIFALAASGEQLVQPQVHEVQAPVRYLDQPLRSPWRRLVENAAVAARHPAGYRRALLQVAAGGRIDRGYIASSRWVCFLQAVALIYLLTLQEQHAGQEISRLHAHFAHDPALVACLAHEITGIPFSFTAHARDLYQVPPGVLADRIERASAVITCCRANLEYLERIAPAHKSKFVLGYHGVNLKDFHPAATSRPAEAADRPLILSVGRLVEKKGFRDLLQALQAVKAVGERFRCHIYGDGPLCRELAGWIEANGLSGDVLLMGDRTQQELIPIYQSAALFVLTPFQTPEGDRDGIPNVLLEAMAVGLPVVTTAASGILELVEHDRSGLLYEPHDVQGIAEGIAQLLRDPQKRAQLGEAAALRVAAQFDVTQAATRLRSIFLSAGT